MKPSDFSKYLTDFLSKYLPHERGASKNTITAYRDEFILFITFMEQQKIKVDKLTVEKITKEKVVEFLDWLQRERNCSTSTRNAQLAAIHSFFQYVQYQHPENLYEYQKILSIRMKKGEKCLLTCKPEYAYGSRGIGPIPGNSTLEFEVELIGWEVKSDSSISTRLLTLAIILFFLSCIAYTYFKSS